MSCTPCKQLCGSHIIRKVNIRDIRDRNGIRERKGEIKREWRERGMDARKIVVVVEDVEAVKTAFLWALHNLLHYVEVITLLHVLPSTKSRSKKKIRLLHLKGFQSALSFEEICSNFFKPHSDRVTQPRLKAALRRLPQALGAGPR